MTFLSINTLDDGANLDADIVIVGGGPCGLTLANSLAQTGKRVLIVESGAAQVDQKYEALNAVEMEPECWREEEFKLRDKYHRNLTKYWDGAEQQYGVRCRGLGGASQAWAGKSAPFEPIDYEERPWVPLSGWPLSQIDLAPFLENATDILNLKSQSTPDDFWTQLRRGAPKPPLQSEMLDSFLWEFSRSRNKATDIMRFGADFSMRPPKNARVLLEATVTEVKITENSMAFAGLTAKNIHGRAIHVSAKTCVLAASAIENARLLLLSKYLFGHRLGPASGQVGKFLLDHPTTTIARASKEAASNLAARYGLYGIRVDRHTHVYMHGLTISDSYQRAKRALNGAIFVSEEHDPDDPFMAVRRLLRNRSKSPFHDMMAVAKSPVRLGRGATIRAMERGYIPAPISRIAANTALLLFPNKTAQDYQFGKLPMKLSGLRFEATTEQPPDPSNCITLSDKKDVLGLPIAKVRWKAGTMARKNLLALGGQFATDCKSSGLSGVTAEDWVISNDHDAAPVIDMGHSMGTTRMSKTPETGVVDQNCQVHGVSGLFAIGGSVIPTSGHANPTLMMLALTSRLGQYLAKS